MAAPDKAIGCFTVGGEGKRGGVHARGHRRRAGDHPGPVLATPDQPVPAAQEALKCTGGAELLKHLLTRPEDAQN